MTVVLWLVGLALFTVGVTVCVVTMTANGWAVLAAVGVGLTALAHHIECRREDSDA